jgi:pimeloyl-ACP methyl ester carboxylesterase
MARIDLPWPFAGASLGRLLQPAFSPSAVKKPGKRLSIVAAMPDARLEVIPGGGHRPDIRTPELVNPLLLEFLRTP